MKVKTELRPLRILDFDIETVATGFGDPQWVPQKVTAIAWSWIGSDKVEVRIDLLEDLDDQDMVGDFLEAYNEADMVTGHNLLRFDLPVLNGECFRRKLRPMKGVLVQDTMRFSKTKGVKKGQDNLGGMLEVPNPKMPLSWWEWQMAYEEKGWKTVVDRVKSDVLSHKLMRQEMIDLGWLKPPIHWSPK